MRRHSIRRRSRLFALLFAAAIAVGCGKPDVLVVGLDGANWAILDPLIDAGHLPNIGHIVRGGARGALYCAPADPSMPCFCPPVWTSIATGVPKLKHRVSGLFTPSSSRGAKAIWNVVHEHGGVVTTLSHRGTWPPEPGIDFVFTEPGLGESADQLFETWLELEHPGREQPATWFQPPDILELLDILPHTGERPPAWSIYARDRVAMDALLRLSVARGLPAPWERQLELTMITLHGPDKVAHLLWGEMQDRMYGAVHTEALLAGAADWQGPVELPGPFGWGPLAGPYLEADEWLGRLLAIRAFDYVVLVSDHGMTRNPTEGVVGQHDAPATEAHLGILAIYGPGVRPGAWIGYPSVLDVAPTLAYLLDLPVARDLTGHVLARAFTPEWLAVKPAAGKTVATWE